MISCPGTILTNLSHAGNVGRRKSGRPKIKNGITRRLRDILMQKRLNAMPAEKEKKEVIKHNEIVTLRNHRKRCSYLERFMLVLCSFVVQ